MRILIDKTTETFLYVIGKSNSVSTWTYIIVLDIKGKQNFKTFYYMYTVELSTSKGANSYILNISKIGNEDIEVY